MAQTVLVVDDETNLRKVLGATLRREGYDVVTAEDGEKAIARFDEGGIDVVVSDLVMPNRDGLDVLRHRGGGPRYVKVGRKVLYDPIDIDRWIEAHKVTPGREATA